MNVERPTFGVTKSERRRRLLPTDPNQEILRAVRLKPLLLKALVESEEGYQEARKAGRERQEELLRAIWGKEVELPKRLSPSIMAKCLRWMGYEMLEEKPVEKTPQQVLAMMWGSSGHYSILRALRPFGVGESSFILDEEEISGRLDFLFFNPKIEAYQIMELKTTSKWGLKNVNRKEIPSWMRKERNLYNPRPEDRLQLLLYIWAKRQEGLSVEFGNIFYVSRDDFQMKECVIIWDAEAEYDVEEFLKLTREAREAIAKGELPQASVDPQSAKYFCGNICSFRSRCDAAQEKLAEAEKRTRKRKPQWARKLSAEKRAELRRKMEEVGEVQPFLPGLY